MMSNNLESKTIEQLLAEADELIYRLNSDFTINTKEEHRSQFAMHAQNLKKIKSEVQGKIKTKKGKSKQNAGAEGMHEAILDIVKAMGNLKHDLT
jgi:predicted RecB family nuclease